MISDKSEVHELPKSILKGSINILNDDKFRQGIDVASTDPRKYHHKVFGYIDYDKTASIIGEDNADGMLNSKRTWHLSQWYSKQNLIDICKFTRCGKNFIYQNDCKTVSVNPTDGVISLHVDTGFEYDGEPRPKFDDWVHLLIEQEPKEITFGKADKFTAYVDFSVDKFENKFNDLSKCDPQKHAAQLVWYFIMESPSGGHLWFGMPLYDNREDGKPWVQGETFTYDKGTDSMIFCVGKNEYFDTQPTVGERYKKTIELTGAISCCYEIAINNGIFKKTDKLEDCRLKSMNFGFEVPGTFEIKATLYQLGVYYHLK